MWLWITRRENSNYQWWHLHTVLCFIYLMRTMYIRSCITTTPHLHSVITATHSSGNLPHSTRIKDTYTVICWIFMSSRVLHECFNSFLRSTPFFYLVLVGFGRACARALRAPVLLCSFTRQTLRCAPPRPSQLRCSPKNIKINYFHKQNVFLQAQPRTARGVYFSTRLSCTLVSYAAPYWATLHPTKLCCIQLSYAAPYLSYAAP